MSRSSHANTLTSGFSPLDRPILAAVGDALSAPTNEDLTSGALAMWPTGPAWGSPDGEAVDQGSVLARFTQVLLEPFVTLYARAWQIVLEASAQTVSDTLEEWEQDYGLPEACFPGEQTRAQRLLHLRRKVEASPPTTPEDFIRIAADYGYEIELEEPCIFECGFSEIAGDHSCGSCREEIYLIVRVRDAAVEYFECSVSEISTDPLFSLGETEQILCLIRQLSPAWVIAVPGEWIE